MFASFGFEFLIKIQHLLLYLLFIGGLRGQRKNIEAGGGTDGEGNKSFHFEEGKFSFVAHKMKQI